MNKRINIEKINPNYFVRELSQKYIQDIYEFCVVDKEYYKIVPPLITKEMVEFEIAKTMFYSKHCDRYYLGFFEFGLLLAIIDFFEFPKQGDTIMINFFMVYKNMQGDGFGTSIIENLFKCFREYNYRYVEIDVTENNVKALHFLEKRGFMEIKRKDEKIHLVKVL